MTETEESIMDKLDAAVPKPLAQFDAFPKLPSTYKARSEGRGFMTLFVAFLAFLMVLNDVGEFIWGWPDYEFSVDGDTNSLMNVNVDIIVAMPCRYISVDLRDAIGDRLFLSKGVLRRDGTLFDMGQATKLKEHTEMLSARQAVAQSRKSRGFFDTLLRRSSSAQFKPTYNFKAHGSSCRVWGSVEVKKVTANLHITALGHGYASSEHVDHKHINLSHIITEFSFGPFFPEIVQPLDNTYEIAKENFMAYQYFLHVVPTVYVAPRKTPLSTNQYSVTHYTRKLDHSRGTPGIFFKFDLDPMSITIHQRTTTFIQFMIRCVGVIGGVFVCMGYAIRVTTAAVEVVVGPDESQGLVAAESSGVKVGLRAKWAGNDLRSRGKMIRQGSGWVLDTAQSPGSPSMYSGDFSPSATPHSSSFPPPSPFLNGPYTPQPSQPGTPVPGSAFPRSPAPPPPRTPRMSTISHSRAASVNNLSVGPGGQTPSGLPLSPNPANGGGFPPPPSTPSALRTSTVGPPPSSPGKKDD